MACGHPMCRPRQAERRSPSADLSSRGNHRQQPDALFVDELERLDWRKLFCGYIQRCVAPDPNVGVALNFRNVPATDSGTCASTFELTDPAVYTSNCRNIFRGGSAADAEVALINGCHQQHVRVVGAGWFSEAQLIDATAKTRGNRLNRPSCELMFWSPQVSPYAALFRLT